MASSSRLSCQSPLGNGNNPPENKPPSIKAQRQEAMKKARNARNANLPNIVPRRIYFGPDNAEMLESAKRGLFN